MVLREYLFTLQIIVTHCLCHSADHHWCENLDYPWHSAFTECTTDKVIQLTLTCPLALLSFRYVTAIPAHKRKVGLLFLSTGQNNPSPVIQCFNRAAVIFRILQFSRFKHFSS